MDLYIDIGIAALISILRRGNPGEMARWRRAVLKVFRTIATAYSRDEEFASVAREFVVQPRNVGTAPPTPKVL